MSMSGAVIAASSDSEVVGDINPADLAQAGSERAWNRIVADGGRRRRSEDPSYGWNHGMQALPAWIGWNQRIYVGDASGSGGVPSRRAGHSIGQVEEALRAACERGHIDDRLARRIRGGFAEDGRPVTEVAVGFVPLVPVLLKAGAAAAADHGVRQALAAPKAAAAATAPTVPAAPVAECPPCPTCHQPSIGAVGVAPAPTSRVDSYRGDFYDLIDTDGYVVRL